MNTNAKGSINRTALVCLLGSLHFCGNTVKNFKHTVTCQKAFASVLMDATLLTLQCCMYYSLNHMIQNNPELELTRGFCHYLWWNVLN